MSIAPDPWTPSGEGAAPPPPAPPPAPAPAVHALPAPLAIKKPGLAAFLSIFPGLGNVYNGLYLRGLIFFLIFFTMFGAVVKNDDNAPFFVPAMMFFWLFSIIDAYRQALLINHGYQQDLGILDLPKRPRAGQGGMVAGIILVLIGIYALLEQYVYIDLDWLFDLWPVVAIALGGWLIWGTIRDRKKEPT
jgi:cell wall-active antibiotic response 4TMS protein YvqF